MSNPEDFIAGAFLGFVAGLIIMGVASTGYWHRQTIRHHAAHYDATTGDWQWNTTNVIIETIP